MPFTRLLFVLGSHTRARFLRSTEPHFLVIHPVEVMPEGASGAAGTEGQSARVPPINANTGQHHLPLPTYPHQQAFLWQIYSTHGDGIHSAGAEFTSWK